MSNAMPPAQVMAPMDKRARSMAPHLPAPVPGQYSYANRNPPPQDTHRKVTEIISKAVDGCFTEVGYVPGLEKRIQDLERDNIAIFEDNRNLLDIANDEKRKVSLIPKPHEELVNLVTNLQTEVRSMQNEIRGLRAEKEVLAGRYHNLATSNPSGHSFQRLQDEYSRLLTVHQNALARLSQTELQMGALATHCRRCPAYASQVQAFQGNNHPQQGFGQATPPSQAEQQQRRSIPHITSGLTHPPTPVMPVPTTPTNLLSGAAHQRSVSTNHFKPPSISKMQTSSGVPFHGFQNATTSRPSPQPAGTIRQITVPQNQSSAPPMPPNPSNHYQQLATPQSFQRSPIHSRPSSSIDYFTNVNVNGECQEIPSQSAILRQHSANPSMQQTTTLRHPANSDLSRRQLESAQSSSSHPRAHSVMSVSSTSRPNSAAPPNLSSIHNNPEHSQPPPQQPRPFTSSLQTQSASPTPPAPACNPESAPSNIPAPSPLPTHLASILHVNDGPATPPPPSATAIVDGHQNSLPTSYSSSKRSSAHFDGPLLENDDSRKKMRMNEDQGQHEKDAPATLASGPPQLEKAMEEEDESDEDEEVPIGPDGLRLIADCLSSLFETEGDRRTCRLCSTRFERALAEKPTPFINARDEVLVEHCTSEHDPAWNKLRHDI